MERIEKFSRKELIQRIAQYVNIRKMDYDINRLRLAPDELLRDFLVKAMPRHYYKS